MNTVLERFEEKVDYTGECHLWTAYKDAGGYGQFRDGKMWYAHRWIWTQTYGPIADGLEMDHMCEVKNCVNVDHLHLVTPLEHCHQPHSKNIGKKHAERTHCPRGHELKEPNLVLSILRTGWRSCLSCNRARAIARLHGHDEAWIQADSDRRYRLLKEKQ